MKPLLPSPWTAEDERIAFRHGRGRWATTLRARSLQADIRDAELMLCLLSSREEIRRPHPEFDAYWWVAFREDLERIAAEPVQ